uniref:Uncharacterized protein n=1 Tax=Prevotella sp. GTC17260 TaxID=3236796 RepID=A0AB33JDX1_9BACT
MGGQQGSIAMKDMSAYINEVLALIEWATKDTTTGTALAPYSYKVMEL